MAEIIEAVRFVLEALGILFIVMTITAVLTGR